MNKKIIDFTSENIQKIILKKPKETTRHTADNPEYISEIWYLDGDRLYQPIVRTPRLKVRNGARQWDDGSWSYRIGLYNYDIDPEIKQFYDSIKDYDKHIITYWTSNKKEWNLCHNKIKAKYFSALRRREPGEDPYLVIKLIKDKEGKVLTIMNNTDREELKPEAITYGTYVDQYISPGFVLFNLSGIHPLWQAHQVVVSPIERVFLGSCLLDVLTPVPFQLPPQLLQSPQFQPPQFQPPQLQPPPPISNSVPVPPQAGTMLGRIKKEELLNAIGKLRSTKPNETPKGDRNKITAEDLLRQRENIKQRAQRNIMMNSIKNIPIEGDELF